MYKFKLARIIIPLVSIFVYTSNASADAVWYAWYQQGGYYGVWATIKAPYSAPYTPPGSGQSHSVTTSGPYWMQAGWLYLDGYSVPQKYYEYCADNCENDPAQFDRVEVGSQPWGSQVKYEVSHDSSMGPKTWCAWIGGIRQFCKDNIRTAPVTVIAQSEVFTSPQVQIDTRFKRVRIRNSSGLWVYPDLNNLFSHFPYEAVKLSSEDFRTFRVNTQDIFLPIITR